MENIWTLDACYKCLSVSDLRRAEERSLWFDELYSTFLSVHFSAQVLDTVLIEVGSFSLFSDPCFADKSTGVAAAHVTQLKLI